MKPSKHKFAFIGTSCSGKTTATHALVGRLKQYGILADGVFSQDRKFSFPLDELTSETAQNWMVANIIAKEADLFLHQDIEILVSDRSPLDLVAYYVHQYDTPLSAAALNYAIEWCKSYTALFYLPPLPFQDDNKRPSDEFRLGVDKTLLELAAAAKDRGVNVVALDRHKVLEHVLKSTDRKKPTAKSALEPADVQRLANFLRLPVAAKFPSADADMFSDTDIWVIASCADIAHYSRLNVILAHTACRWLSNHCGSWPNFDVLVTTTPEGLPPSAQLFTPSSF